jgi:glyoxylase-like metal-dependent hydrolase (beta-lactamase superfamily II)
MAQVALKLKTFVLGDLGNNAYLLYDDLSKEAFLIDVPKPSLEIKRFLQKNELVLKFVLLTHGHFDHIWGFEGFSVPFFIHPKDEEFLTDPRINASLFCGEPVAIREKPNFLEGNDLTFGSQKIEVIHTPGHTPGSVCFKVGDWLFSGDTLFRHSIGRTDIPFASYEDIIASIKNKLLVFDPATIVYPGHGGPTTIGEEERNNQFLRES